MILIAGGSGFYGVNTARCLADQGKEVLLLQRHPLASPPPLLEPYWDREVKQYAGDVLDLPTLMGTVDAFGVESIIHAALMTSGVAHDPHGVDALHPLVRVQVEGCTNCLETARLLGLRRVTFVSSVDLYRGKPHACEGEWSEDAFLPPVSFSLVGNLKRAVEQIGLLYMELYDVGFASLRVGSNYGAVSMHPVNAMVEVARGNGRPELLSRLSSNRRTHPIYARDTGLATGAVHLADSLEHEIYNVSDGTNPTMAEIAGTVGEMFGGAEILLGPAAEGDPRAEYHPQPMTRMKEELGFTPMTLREGVEHYVNYLETGAY
jgi:nucleoside-diphosphate-sugar epimerase